jgi:hypothetical protein
MLDSQSGIPCVGHEISRRIRSSAKAFEYQPMRWASFDNPAKRMVKNRFCECKCAFQCGMGLEGAGIRGDPYHCRERKRRDSEVFPAIQFVIKPSPALRRMRAMIAHGFHDYVDIGEIHRSFSSGKPSSRTS